MMAKKSIYALVIWVSLSILPSLWAHQPSSIDLSYDQEKEILMIKLKHVTHNVREHYIRKIEIYKNDELMDKFYYSAQPRASQFTKEVSLKLKEGDVIRVKAICEEAGYKEATLLIP